MNHSMEYSPTPFKDLSFTFIANPWWQKIQKNIDHGKRRLLSHPCSRNNPLSTPFSIFKTVNKDPVYSSLDCVLEYEVYQKPDSMRRYV